MIFPTALRRCKQLFWHVIMLSFLFSTTNTFAQEPVKIGLCLAGLHADRWYRDRDYLIQHINEQNGTVLLRVADDDAEKQYQQALELLNMGADLLIVIAVDGNAAADIVNKAHDYGVKVIAYDRLILNSDLDFYVSFDGIKVGELIADYALKRKPKGNYLLLEGPISDNNSRLFSTGKHKLLDSYVANDSIHIIYESNMDAWNQVSTFLELQKFFSENQVEVDVVLSSQDKLTAGAIMALENMNIPVSPLVITGQDASIDACRNILNGKQDMTIYKPMEKLARMTVDIALKLVNGQKINAGITLIDNGKKEIPAVLLEPILVDSENIQQVLIESGFYSKKELTYY